MKTRKVEIENAKLFGTGFHEGVSALMQSKGVAAELLFRMSYACEAVTPAKKALDDTLKAMRSKYFEDGVLKEEHTQEEFDAELAELLVQTVSVTIPVIEAKELHSKKVEVSGLAIHNLSYLFVKPEAPEEQGTPED
ncbi:hypothetical protein OAF54_02900 [bacterium]|nr:hypothetical protein [bacterium]